MIQSAHTTKQAAQVLQVSTEGILALIHAGHLVASDVSRPGSKKPRWRILSDDLEAFLTTRRHTPPVKTRRRRRQAGDVIQFF